MLEFMARGGMRIDEVLGITPGHIQESSLTIHNPQSGRAYEKV
jgi:integrase